MCQYVIPVRLDYNSVEVFHSLCHVCRHGVTGPQRQDVLDDTLKQKDIKEELKD